MTLLSFRLFSIYFSHRVGTREMPPIFSDAFSSCLLFIKFQLLWKIWIIHFIHFALSVRLFTDRLNCKDGIRFFHGYLKFWGRRNLILVSWHSSLRAMGELVGETFSVNETIDKTRKYWILTDLLNACSMSVSVRYSLIRVKSWNEWVISYFLKTNVYS